MESGSGSQILKEAKLGVIVKLRAEKIQLFQRIRKEGLDGGNLRLAKVQILKGRKGARRKGPRFPAWKGSGSQYESFHLRG